MALFTGKGDAGTTRVLDSTGRISKASELPEALGSLDELNSFVGLAKVWGLREGGPYRMAAEILHDIQETLFIVQAEVAGADKHVELEKVLWTSDLINALERKLPPITAFTIAGGTELAALIDVARTLARRAERRIVAVDTSGARTLSPHTLAYMNRLSSLLFALARITNHAAGIEERNPSYK